MMLGLATHEPHFSLLREEVRFGGKKDRNKRYACVQGKNALLSVYSVLLIYVLMVIKYLQLCVGGYLYLWIISLSALYLSALYIL